MMELPWAGWAMGLIVRHGRRDEAARLAMPFFTRRPRARSGPMIVQHRKRVHHHWSTLPLTLTLAIGPQILRVRTTRIAAAGPHVLQLRTASQRTERLRLRQPPLGLHRRTADRTPPLRAEAPFAGPGSPREELGIWTRVHIVHRTISAHLVSHHESVAAIRHRLRTEIERTLVRRTRRVDETAPSPMQLRRTPPHAAAAPGLPPEAGPSRQWQRMTGRDAEQAMPAIAVDQLTTQVLRELDRRVTARRERMGQR